MTEFDRIQELTNEMVSIWAWCWENVSDFMDLDEE